MGTVQHHWGCWLWQGMTLLCLAVPRLCWGADAAGPVKQAALTAMAAAVCAGSYDPEDSRENRYLGS